MYKPWIFAFALATAGTMLLSPQSSAGPHGPGYYACNGKNQGSYYRFVKKRSDAQEKAFMQAVRNLPNSGGCSTVRYPETKPSSGIELAPLI
jgi:hypothetical protein